MTDYTPLRRPLKRDPEDHDDDRQTKQARRDIAPRQVEPRENREIPVVKCETQESSSSARDPRPRRLSSSLLPAPTLSAESRPITDTPQADLRSSAASDDLATTSTGPVLQPKGGPPESAPHQSSPSRPSANPPSPWHARPPVIPFADTWSGPGPNPYLFTGRLSFETGILDIVKRVSAPGMSGEASLSSGIPHVFHPKIRSVIRKIAWHPRTVIRTGPGRCSQCKLSDTPPPSGWERYPCAIIRPDESVSKRSMERGGYLKCVACLFPGSVCNVAEVDEHQHGSDQKQAEPLESPPVRASSSGTAEQPTGPLELLPDRASSSRSIEPQADPSQESRTTAPDPASNPVDPPIRSVSLAEVEGPQPSRRLDLECNEHIYSCQGLARRIQTVVKYLEDRDLVAACAALAIIEKQSGNVREEVDKLDKLIRR